MSLGALRLPLLVITAVGATTSAVLALRDSDRKLEAVPALFFALGAWSLIQACPLPLPLLRMLAPKNAQIWAHAFQLTGNARRWASISLDPGSSAVEALKWSSYGAAAISAGYVARGLGVRVVAGLTFMLALLVAATTMLHGLLHAHALYGLYVPTFDPGPWGFGPILNPNNRAGYLNLGAFAGLSLLVARDRQGRTWPIVIGVGCLVAVAVLARSRGGIGALAAGSVLLVIFLLRKASGHDGPARWFYLRLAVPPLVALAGGVTLAALGSEENTWDTLRHEGLSKLHVFWWTRPMLADFPFFGVGRGAFETVFPAYQQSGSHAIYQHAENFVMDWICDWGSLAAVPALFAFASLLRRRPDEQPLRTVLRLALGVLLMQNLVDHALETPAIAMLAATVVAALATESRKTTISTSPSEEIAGTHNSAFSATALSIAMAALIAVALVWGRHSALEERRRLSLAFRELPSSSNPADARMLLDKISDSVVRHPGDAFLPLLGAMTARHVPGTRPLRWLAWALERDMMSGHAHLALAYFLLKVSALEQAFTELRTAAELDASLQTRAAVWAIAYAREPTDALNAVPDGAEGAPTLLIMSGSPRLRSHRFDLLEMATQRDPASLTAQTSAATAFLEALEIPEGTRCHFAEQASCVERLNRHILAIARLEPRSSLATEMTARMLVATGRGSEGRELLSSACSSFASPERCWQTRIMLAHGQPADAPFRDALRSYFAAACTHDEQCIRAASWLAGTLEQRGDFIGALEYYNRAVRAGSENAQTWLAIARVARAAGQPQRAADALRRAGRATEDPQLRRETDQALLNSLAEENSRSGGTQ